MGIDSDSHEPLVSVAALHALQYCERLFYLEEVEEIRVADARVYAGRTLHEELQQDEVDERRSFDLSSEELGLIGRVDAIRHRDGGWIPYEHKRGRARRSADDAPEAWPSDALQVAAYGMLLEELHGRPVLEGRVRYHADNATVRVSIDDEARAKVRAAVARARELRVATVRPPVTDNERLCVRCSLAPVCLPEEERLATHPERKPMRLFPPHPDGQVLHVTSRGAWVRRSGNELRVDIDGAEGQRFPIHQVQAVVLHGYTQISAQAIQLCAARRIGVHWISNSGRYTGGLVTEAGPVQRRIRQYEALRDHELCLSLTRRLATARMEGQLRYLLRATRSGESRSHEILAAIDDIRASIKAIRQAESVDSARGHEGAASRAYFGVFPTFLGPAVPEDLRPGGRSRRPPRDRFNALLSFGYSLLYRSVLQATLAVGLEPAFGFYHSPRSAAHPLVLDLMELFRVPIWDIAVIGSINRLQWDPDEDFSVTREHVWLSDSGRRKAIGLYERRVEEQWKHVVTGYSLSYARTIELEVRLLEKEWLGQPGLFARARIR
jgi:CRISPR-associated protein Cas1